MKISRLHFPCLVLAMQLIAGVAASAQTRAKVGATLAVTDPGAWKRVQRGLEYRNVALERSEPGYTLTLKLLRFDSRTFVPRVISATDLLLKGATAKTFAEKFRAVAAVNANYFDPKGRPLAYLKTATKEINPSISKHALYTGVFGVRDSTPFIVHRDDFEPPGATVALQSGPLLLHRGAAVEAMPGLGRYARRAVIGIDKEGRVIIAVTEAVVGGLSFPELQEIFGAPRWQIETLDLLNLDGGGSAQLYVKAEKFEDWLPGTTEVPVAIAFFLNNN